MCESESETSPGYGGLHRDMPSQSSCGGGTDGGLFTDMHVCPHTVAAYAVTQTPRICSWLNPTVSY